MVESKRNALWPKSIFYFGGLDFLYPLFILYSSLCSCQLKARSSEIPPTAEEIPFMFNTSNQCEEKKNRGGNWSSSAWNMICCWEISLSCSRCPPLFHAVLEAFDCRCVMWGSSNITSRNLFSVALSISTPSFSTFACWNSEITSS